MRACALVADGPLPADRVPAYGQQLAGALAHAHGCGVVHRDIKSARTIRLAVLPFDNVSGDEEQDFLADGITEEVIAELGRLHPETLSSSRAPPFCATGAGIRLSVKSAVS